MALEGDRSRGGKSSGTHWERRTSSLLETASELDSLTGLLNAHARLPQVIPPHHGNPTVSRRRCLDSLDKDTMLSCRPQAPPLSFYNRSAHEVIVKAYGLDKTWRKKNNEVGHYLALLKYQICDCHGEACLLDVGLRSTDAYGVSGCRWKCCAWRLVWSLVLRAPGELVFHGWVWPAGPYGAAQTTAHTWF